MKTVGEEKPLSRSAGSLAAVGSKLYLFGGLNQSVGWLDDFFVFDIGKTNLKLSSPLSLSLSSYTINIISILHLVTFATALNVCKPRTTCRPDNIKYNGYEYEMSL